MEANVAEDKDVVYGGVYDITKYFQTICLAERDRWKWSSLLGGEFIDERRVVMGRSSSPQTAQRLSFLIFCYLQNAFDRGLPKALASMSETTRGIVDRWVARRLKAIPGIPDQARPAFFAVLQDDFTVAVIGAELVSWLEAQVYSALESELQIQLSRKPAASVPFDRAFSGIGATYTLQGRFFQA